MCSPSQIWVLAQHSDIGNIQDSRLSDPKLQVRRKLHHGTSSVPKRSSKGILLKGAREERGHRITKCQWSSMFDVLERKTQFIILYPVKVLFKNNMNIFFRAKKA